MLFREHCVFAVIIVQCSSGVLLYPDLMCVHVWCVVVSGCVQLWCSDVPFCPQRLEDCPTVILFSLIALEKFAQTSKSVDK